jgi:hypothetical protein
MVGTPVAIIEFIAETTTVEYGNEHNENTNTRAINRNPIPVFTDHTLVPFNSRRSKWVLFLNIVSYNVNRLLKYGY